MAELRPSFAIAALGPQAAIWNDPLKLSLVPGSAMTLALPDDNRRALRLVMRAQRKAALGTVMEGGAPYVSLVTVALDHDCAPVLLLSGLSDHTRNLHADPRVSLLFDGTEGHANPQSGPRVTLTGVAEPTDDERLKRRFLARHPGARLYAGFGDFGFWRVRPLRAHFVGGFGRAVWFNHPFGLDPHAAATLARAEDELLARLNARFASALDLIARRNGTDGEGWRLTALDPDGFEMERGEECLRVAFEAPVRDAEAAAEALAALAAAVK